MDKARLAVSAVLMLCVSLETAPCKDFPESVLSVDPLAAASRTGAPAGMGASFEYCSYAFAHDEVDDFYFRLGASPVLFDLGRAFAIGAIYESILLGGPIRAGTKAANIAGFWMNAVEFEYGLYASLALPGPAGNRPHILVEYSRTSLHPLGSPGLRYSQVSADLLMIGLSLPELRAGGFSALSYIRAGYSDLFGFWHSSLPKPRISWLAKPAVEARLEIREGLFAVARAYPELFIDLYKKGPDANFFGEAGLALGRGLESLELLATIYATRDSDMLADGAHPTLEAGLALRLSTGRARPPSGLER